MPAAGNQMYQRPVQSLSAVSHQSSTPTLALLPPSSPALSIHPPLPRIRDSNPSGAVETRLSSSDLPARTRSQTRLGSRPPAVGAGTASAPGCSTGICGIANPPVLFLVRYVGGTKGALGWIGGRTAPSAGCQFRLWHHRRRRRRIQAPRGVERRLQATSCPHTRLSDCD